MSHLVSRECAHPRLRTGIHINNEATTPHHRCHPSAPSAERGREGWAHLLCRPTHSAPSATIAKGPQTERREEEKLCAALPAHRTPHHQLTPRSWPHHKLPPLDQGRKISSTGAPCPHTQLGRGMQRTETDETPHTCPSANKTAREHPTNGRSRQKRPDPDLATL